MAISQHRAIMVDYTDPQIIEQLQSEVAQLRDQVARLAAARQRTAQALSALRRSEHQYRALVDNLIDVVFSIDLHGRFTYVSPSVSRFSLYTPAELVGQDFSHFIHPDDRLRVQANLHETMNGVLAPREFRIMDKDGRIHYVRNSGRPLVRGGCVVGAVGMLTNLSAQWQAEMTYQTHDEQVQLIAESIPVPIVITRLSDTTVLAANTQISELFGWPHELLLGRLARDFFYSQREFRQLVLQVHRKGGVRNCQARGVKADGTVFWLAASIEQITFRGEAALVSGFFDLTERFQSEAALRQFAAELQTRNDELDAFSHTVAHDLKSPLSLIMGYAEILREMEAERPEYGERLEYLGIIGQTASKINNIVEELMLLAEVRKGGVELQPLNMAQIAQESRARLGYLIAAQNAEMRVSGNWPVAVGHAAWVEEIWINYLSNAIKYGGRPPRVEMGADHTPDHGQVRFWVRDNGQGLTPEQQSRLFTPFTKLAQVRATGHGLGLSIVRRIVEKLGGTVGVESTIGLGSTFYFTLPAVEMSE